MGLELKIKNDDSKALFILWEGEIWRKVYKPLFFNELKKIPRSLTWEEFLAHFYPLEEKIGKRYALYLLSCRSYFSSDLEAKLFEKGFSPSCASSVVAFCQEKGYLNDREKIEQLVAKERSKGKGARVIYAKLKQKKMAPIDFSEEEEEKALFQWLAKHVHKVDLSNQLEKQKLIAKLLRRGFSLSMILQALDGNKFDHRL